MQSLIVSVTLICKFNFFLSRYACPVCGLDNRCLWWLKEQFTDCLTDKALMAYLKIHSSWLVPRLQLVSRRSTKLGGCFPKGTCQITAKTTTNFDSHLFIELIEDDWLFDLKKHIYKKLLPETGKIRELKQPRRRRQQKPHKFAYLTMENSIFARFARAFFIF